MTSVNSPTKTAPVSLQDLQRLWSRLSYQYFEGRLPPIRIEWSSRLTASSGMFVSQVGPRSRHVSREERHGSARCIRLSLPLLRDQPEAEIIRTLAHEMIHQWQYDIKKKCPNHGQDFSQRMIRMNEDGLGISIRHTLHQEVDRFCKYLWTCVACGMTYRRQRRTISPRRHRCGNCSGTLEEVLLRTEEKFETPTFETVHSIPSICKQQSQPVNNQLPQQLVLNF